MNRITVHPLPRQQARRGQPGPVASAVFINRVRNGTGARRTAPGNDAPPGCAAT